MAVVPVDRVVLPSDANGYNLTDSGDFEVLGTGAGNGAEFTFAAGDLIVLKNTTGGNATYTFKCPVPDDYESYEVTFTDPTLVVGAGDTVIVKLSSLFSDSTTGKITIECNVAGSILVLDP